LASNADAQTVLVELRRLIEEDGPQAGVSFAEELEGPDALVHQLHALAYSEAGKRLKDRGLLERSIACCRSLGAEKTAGYAYNLAVTEQALWELAAADDRVAAFESDRHHLHETRRLYELIVADEAAKGDDRVQAATNLGNSLDHGGRDVDALARYDEALAIRPGFGMARGNRGLMLLGIAPFVGEHQPVLLHEAVLELDAAIAAPEDVAAFGGPSAHAEFARQRSRIKGPESTLAELPASSQLRDPHLEWCRRQGLLLHPSLRCINNTTDPLDPIFFTGLVLGVSEEEQVRLQDLLDAFGALKQEYVATRYLAWLAEDYDSPIREHASEVSAKVKFFDSLSYARWGVRTGLAALAFAAAMNLLDKVAGFVHLYLGTDRVRDVYFRTLWHPRSRGGDDVMDSALADELRAGNRGLLALCDLSCDLDFERKTPLAELVELRHTATHRFLVSHDMLLEGRTPASEWVQRVGARPSSTLLARLTSVSIAAVSGSNPPARRGPVSGGMRGVKARASGGLIFLSTGLPPSIPSSERRLVSQRSRARRAETFILDTGYERV
jgi:hypothetical protein